ncbi:MAG: hypothetical protein ACXIVQ_00940 [Acidimicrobiales bacterium]
MSGADSPWGAHRNGAEQPLSTHRSGRPSGRAPRSDEAPVHPKWAATFLMVGVVVLIVVVSAVGAYG